MCQSQQGDFNILSLRLAGGGDSQYHVTPRIYFMTILYFLSSGGAVLHHLLEWVQNGHADKYVKDVLRHPQPHESPAYWPAVSITNIEL